MDFNMHFCPTNSPESHINVLCALYAMYNSNSAENPAGKFKKYHVQTKQCD